jgi:Arc/MetJ family transcription regulator
LVYGGVVSRTNIDLDDEAVADVMRTYRFATKREAVNFALNEVRRRRPLPKADALALQGSGGWEGDLAVMRDSAPVTR